MKTKHILLIINPVSGRMRSRSGLFEILDELYRADSTDGESKGGTGTLAFPFGNLTPTTLGGEPDPERQVIVCPTMHRGHAAQLAASSVRVGVDTVVCCDGDGTLNETISGLMTLAPDERPMLGYIPVGSTNDFAASMGLPSSLRGAARRAVGDSESTIDIGCFQPHSREQDSSRYFSYIASFGIFTATSYSTSQSFKNVMGHVAYLLEGVKDLANIQPHHVAFDLSDGTHVEGDYVFGAVTNTTSAGGVVKLPADRVSMSDGELEVFLIHHPRTVAELNRIIAALWSSDFDGCPLIELHHTRTAHVTLEQSLTWSLDGEEAVGGTEVEIRCIPQAIRLKGNPSA